MIFDDNLVSLPNDYILIATQLVTFMCASRMGMGQLEWIVEDGDGEINQMLKRELQNIAGIPGSHSFVLKNADNSTVVVLKLKQ